MRLQNVRIGFAFTGSFCTFQEVAVEAENLAGEGAQVFPIMSYAASGTDTKYGQAADWRQRFEAATGHKAITTITEAEPVGPGKLFDIMVIAPCTGNTVAKLVNGITDTPVLMAAKAHLRNQRPVVIAVSTNDGLGMNAKNIGLLLNTKNIYLVPFGQDNPESKANSLVAHMRKITDTVIQALQGKQIQPVLVSPK